MKLSESSYPCNPESEPGNQNMHLQPKIVLKIPKKEKKSAYTFLKMLKEQ